MKINRLLPVRRDLAQLESRFQTARESYDELRQTCESRVSRWEWATGAAYSLDPLFFLDPGIGVGKISSSPPESPAGWTAYGLTNDDRITAERQYTDRSDQYYQGFYLDLPDRTVGYRFHFSTSRNVINCSQLIFDGSRPSYFQRWGSRGWFTYTYACGDHGIESFVGAAKEPDEPERQFSGQVRYRENGVVELWVKEQGHRVAELSFRGKPPVDNPFIRRRQ